MSTHPTELPNRLNQIIQTIEAIPDAKLDDEDRQVSLGLIMLAKAHQETLLPNVLARLSVSGRDQLFTTVVNFCNEVETILGKSAAESV